MTITHKKTVTRKAYICHLVLEVLLIVTLPLGHLRHLVLQLGCQQDIRHLDNNLEELGQKAGHQDNLILMSNYLR